MKINRKFMLAALFLLCLAPTSFAVRPNRDHDHGCDPRRQRCQQVPEGGSAAIYLLGAGITCLGAMVIRSRSLASTQS